MRWRYLTPMKLKLVVNYLPPSLNVTKRSHWTKQYREKQKAFDALEYALLDIAVGPSTLTTSPLLVRTCSMALNRLDSYRMILGGQFAWKQNKKKLNAVKTRGSK